MWEISGGILTLIKWNCLTIESLFQLLVHKPSHKSGQIVFGEMGPVELHV